METTRRVCEGIPRGGKLKKQAKRRAILVVKIRVSYSELKSGPGYNNRKAEAEIEIEVSDGNIDRAYQKAWDRVISEVHRQLDRPGDDIPF